MELRDTIITIITTISFLHSSWKSERNVTTDAEDGNHKEKKKSDLFMITKSLGRSALILILSLYENFQKHSIPIIVSSFP